MAYWISRLMSLIVTHTIAFVIPLSLVLLIVGRWDWWGPSAAAWFAAAGTIFTGVVALLLGLREGWQRRRADRRLGQLASVILYPEVRRFLAGISRLRSHPVVNGSDGLTDAQSEELQGLIGFLRSTDFGNFDAMIHQLPRPRDLEMAQALAHVRHAARHAQDLRTFFATSTATERSTKRQALKTAIAAARRSLVKLSLHCRRQLRDLPSSD